MDTVEALKMGLPTPVRPHPAFDETCVPGTRSYELRMHRRHYPPGYLNQLMNAEIKIQFDNLVDYPAYVLMKLTFWGSWILAVLMSLNFWESKIIGPMATVESVWEAIFLRQAVILTGLAWVHPQSVFYSYHIKSIFFLLPSPTNSTIHLISPLTAEFTSHVVHASTFLEALKPMLPLRAIVTVVQLIALHLYTFVAAVWPPLCHAFARMMWTKAARVYIEAAKIYELQEMPRLMSVEVPHITKWFYGLEGKEGAPPATWKDVLLSIAADDIFHATYNQTAAMAFPDPKVFEYMKPSLVMTREVEKKVVPSIVK